MHLLSDLITVFLGSEKNGLKTICDTKLRVTDCFFFLRIEKHRNDFRCLEYKKTVCDWIASNKTV